MRTKNYYKEKYRQQRLSVMEKLVCAPPLAPPPCNCSSFSSFWRSLGRVFLRELKYPENRWLTNLIIPYPCNFYYSIEIIWKKLFSRIRTSFSFIFAHTSGLFPTITINFGNSLMIMVRVNTGIYTVPIILYCTMRYFIRQHVQTMSIRKHWHVKVQAARMGSK